MAVARLLDHIVSITPTHKTSVGNLIVAAISPKTGADERAQAIDTLSLIGIRLFSGPLALRAGFSGTAVVVSNSHAEIVKIFHGTPWAGKWKDQLARCTPGALSLSTFRFGAARHRAVGIPAEFFMASDPATPPVVESKAEF